MILYSILCIFFCIPLFEPILKQVGAALISARIAVFLVHYCCMMGRSVSKKAGTLFGASDGIIEKKEGDKASNQHLTVVGSVRSMRDLVHQNFKRLSNR